MPTLRELNAKLGDRFKRDGIKEFVVSGVVNPVVAGVALTKAYGENHWEDGSKVATWWGFDHEDDWERIEENPEAVTEPPQHVYAYLSAQYGIIIIADGVTYDGTKQ